LHVEQKSAAAEAAAVGKDDKKKEIEFFQVSPASGQLLPG
jgi:hypothetical protein